MLLRIFHQSSPEGLLYKKSEYAPPPRKNYSLFTVIEGSEGNPKFVKTSVLMEGE